MRVVVYESAFFWRIKLAGANRETLMVSETYYTAQMP
jgi:uncharacterized protein YegP (UPF0339 family)